MIWQKLRKRTAPIGISLWLNQSLARMSRRASVFARQNPGKRRVRFPDEVVFEDEIKEQDGMAVMDMLRRASIDIDINRINSAGQKSPRHY